MSLKDAGSFDVALPVGGSTISVLPDEPNRVGLVIENTGANPLKLGIGNDDPSSTGYTVNAGRFLEFTNPDTTPTGYLTANSVLGTTISIISIKKGF